MYSHPKKESAFHYIQEKIYEIRMQNKIWRKFYTCETIFKSKIQYKKLEINFILVKNWKKISNLCDEKWI